MITLLTDFGLSDAYVGIMKGIILGINPEAKLVDLSHQIPAQDIQTASFQLANAYPYFPAGTIYLVVIDPGVGSQREAVAIDLGQSRLVGPNNGVFSAVLNKVEPLKAVKLDNPNYWTQSQPSSTFHGRDIFSPVAAHLSTGVAIAQVGSPFPIEQLVCTPINRTSFAPDAGYIQSIDHFGNLITTLPGSVSGSEEHSNWQILFQEQVIQGAQTYSDVEPGQVVALIGSHGFIEIAVNQGSARDYFQATLNTQVWLKQDR